MTAKINHIAIVVADIDKALAVYHDTLGLPLEAVHDEPDEAVRVAYMPTPSGESGTDSAHHRRLRRRQISGQTGRRSAPRVSGSGKHRRKYCQNGRQRHGDFRPAPHQQTRR